MAEENVVTDSNVVKEQVSVVNDDAVEAPKEKMNFEVVFFARYNTNPRPNSEDIVNLFNKYGTVHHVNCPEGRNYAFIFMSSLNTTAEQRRTRTTISQIIRDMTPENRFHITVASSNRAGDAPRRNNSGYSNQSNRPYNNYGSHQDNQSLNGAGRRPYMRNADRNEEYDSTRPVRRPYVNNQQTQRPTRAMGPIRAYSLTTPINLTGRIYQPTNANNPTTASIRRP